MIKTIITTIDNLPNNQEQIHILHNDPLIDEIIIVNNGSIDGTQEWLNSQDGLTVINRENDGAGPGRNAGLDKAGEFDYVLMLDGGIRPLIGGVEKMLDYLERTPEADVIGVEIPDLETDHSKAWRRWPNSIDAYRNTRLSHTAYCLARYKAFDGIRFCEVGPFSEPGWGCDDDELCYQWNDKDIVIHVATKIHPYRRGSGSFNRLYQETGIWPNQYGSVYEKRLVWLQQNWPQYEPGVMWGYPWLTVIINNPTLELIKLAHDELRKRRFASPFDNSWNPYHIIVTENKPEFEPRRLRQHHGNKTIIDGEIITRGPENEATWAGDFIVSPDWQPNDATHYWGVVSNEKELMAVITEYNQVYLRQDTKQPPTVNGVRLYG